jgi:hypothetical protein
VRSPSLTLRETIKIEVELLGEIATYGVSVIDWRRRLSWNTRSGSDRCPQLGNLDTKRGLKPTGDGQTMARSSRFLVTQQQCVRASEPNEVAIHALRIKGFELRPI